LTPANASGISGDIASSLYRDKIDVPFYVNKEYDLPKWARKDTLTIFFSYSGNTDETISAFKIASQKKCRIITISSGGKLQELSEKRGVTHITIPSGYQPRAAIAYSLFSLIVILKRVGLLRNEIETEINDTILIIKELIDSINKTVAEEKFYQPEYLAPWKTKYCIDSMLEHAVMHPIRHHFQLKELMDEM